MSVMVVFAPAALAHHPEVDAYETCLDAQPYIHFDAISWKTDGSSGSGHADIRIEIRVNGSGSWIDVTGGAFTAVNNYRFSGDIDSGPYWGDSVEIRARANGAWDNGQGGGETWTTNPITIDQDCFNPSCPGQYFEYKVEPVTEGLHGSFFTVSNIQDGGSGPTFDWSSTVPVFQVIVKGGPGANLYNYSGDTSDTGLHSPLNTKNGKWFGLSHVTFCYGEPEAEPVDVTPMPQVCELIQGSAQGAISFAIDPVAGAVVQVYLNPNFTGPVGAGLADGQELSLSPGTYYWQATASSSDYELTGPTSGEFTIDPCEASVVVISGNCVLNDNGAPVGAVEVTIDPDSGATVVITGPGGPYNFSGDGGSMELVPGSYAWTASPGSGFTLGGETSGEFTIDPCDSSVIIVAGGCVVNENGAALGSVQVNIDPDSGATVVITGPGGPYNFSGDGGSMELVPGSYAWTASPGSGFTLGGETSGEFTIDPCEASVVVISGNCVLNDNGVPVGAVEVNIDPDSGATVVITGPGGPYNFSGDGGAMELAPGSYAWAASPGSGFTLGGETSGEFTIEPCDVSVLVVSGECEILDGPTGSVTAFIDTDSGATVTVYDDELSVAATFSGSGGTSVLPPGTYSWEATPGDGFDLPEGQQTSGQFTIDPCEGTVIVSYGNCVEGAATAFGSMTVVIDPGSAAVVTVRNDTGQVVATFDEDGGSQALVAGAYTWDAQASAGFAMTGDSVGQFTVVACDDEVLDEEIENDDPEDEVRGLEVLPFTGIDTWTLFGASIVLLGSGWVLIRSARRREED
jgi:hypothetical protein